MLFSYMTEQVWLTHCKYRHIQLTLMSTHPNNDFTSYWHICQKQICLWHFTYLSYMSYLPGAYIMVYKHICTACEVTGISHVTMSTVHITYNLHFMLLAHIIQQIWLLHYNCRLHCHYSVLVHRSDIGVCMYQNIKYNICLHVIVIHVSKTNMSTTFHIHAIYNIYLMDINGK